MSDPIVDLLERLSPEVQGALAAYATARKGKWAPSPGPQRMAYETEADLLLYGGQAGGGKSALLTGLALTKHQNSLLMRRQYSDLSALVEDTLRQHGTRKGFNGSPPAKLRTEDGRLIEFGGAKLPGDEEHWQGQPHDFIGIDEASQFLESQVRFLMGWNRPASGHDRQRCRVVLATNPPIQIGVGEWLRSWEWFGAWLDPTYPNPAKPGEIRWFVSDEDGHFEEVDGPAPREVGGKIVTPKSRTFIPAELSDNPFLKNTNYRAELDALPEPMRSAVRDGNWMIAHEDNAWQVIPTNWLLQAQMRWTDTPPSHAPLSCIGVDVAQGGADKTVLAPRYDGHFAELIVVPGRETPLGSDVAALVLKHRRNGCDVVIDVGGGYGGGAVEHLTANKIPVMAFNGASESQMRTKDRKLGFVNKRAEAWWRFREALDPDQDGGSPIAVPYDSELLADLAAPLFEVTPRGIKVESKQDIIKRLGRSPDRGDAVVMAYSDGPKMETHGRIWREALKTAKRPAVKRGHELQRR